ncbi:MAG: hypothetical protein ACRDPY_49545, partial [Streptosporangiaceae bacterium]
MKNPAAGGGRWVEVPPERLVSWIVTFTERHGGPLTVSYAEPAAAVTFTAADGAAAECHVPFPPLPLRTPLPSAPLRADPVASPPPRADPVASPPPRADPVASPPPSADPVASPPPSADPLPSPPPSADPGETGPDALAAAGAIAAHAAADRTVGVLLVRLGGYA